MNMTTDMPVIARAISDSEIVACYDVLAQLRPYVNKLDLLKAVRRMGKEGYCLAYLSVSGVVCGVAGYRIMEMLRTGRIIEVDDFVVADNYRSKRYGKLIFDWLVEEARRMDCCFIELDSAVERRGAHRFYFRERMHILAFHFSLAINEHPPYLDP